MRRRLRTVRGPNLPGDHHPGGSLRSTSAGQATRRHRRRPAHRASHLAPHPVPHPIPHPVPLREFRAAPIRSETRTVERRTRHRRQARSAGWKDGRHDVATAVRRPVTERAGDAREPPRPGEQPTFARLARRAGRGTGGRQAARRGARCRTAVRERGGRPAARLPGRTGHRAGPVGHRRRGARAGPGASRTPPAVP